MDDDDRDAFDRAEVALDGWLTFLLFVLVACALLWIAAPLLGVSL